MSTTHESSAPVGLSITDTATARVVRNLAMTPEADESSSPALHRRHG